MHLQTAAGIFDFSGTLPTHVYATNGIDVSHRRDNPLALVAHTLLTISLRGIDSEG